MSFEFLPKTLVAKCNRLIKAHHGTHGYSTLPHLLWQDEETRQFMEAHDELRLLFKKARDHHGPPDPYPPRPIMIT